MENITKTPAISHFSIKKAYLEITEQCNLTCPFCPSATLKGARGKMSEQLFENILQKIQGHVNEIYLHVLGEPMLHPQFPHFLELASAYSIPVNLTTNGLLITKHAENLLSSNALRQVNFSTHAYAYLPHEKAETTLRQTLKFVTNLAEKRPEVYVNFRLWNSNSDERSTAWNESVLQTLSTYFHTDLSHAKFSIRHKSTPIREHIYLHQDSRFSWPDGTAEENENGTCHGVLDQFAVLFDGRVVPCCLDYHGAIVLGKFPEDSFESIFNGLRATQMKNGFIQYKLTEGFCRRCGFAKRFKKR